MSVMDSMNRNLRSFGGAPRELWLVYLLKLIESYAYFSMSQILTLYLSAEFGMSDLRAGGVYGMFGALVTLYGFLVGFLVDNLGVRKSLFLGYSALVIGRFLLAVAVNLWVLHLCLYLLMPFGSALGIPVLSMGIKQYTNQRNRGFAFGLFYAVMNVGAIVSGEMVDALELGVKGGRDIFGFHFSSKRLILLSGAVASVFGLLITFAFREIKVGERGSGEEGVKTFEVEQASPWKIAKELLCMKMFWQFMAITLICVNLKCLFRYLDALLPKYLVREFGDGVPKGTINAINPAIIIVLVPLVSAFTSRVKPYRMIHFGSYISALSPLPLCFMTSIPAAVLFVTILSVGEAFWSPRFYDLTVSMAPEGREGTFVALGSAPIFLAKLPVGFLSGYLLEAFCPKEGPRDSTKMWWVLFCITAPAPLMLTLFKKCLGNIEAPEQSQDKGSAVVSSEESTEDRSSDDDNEDLEAENSVGRGRTESVGNDAVEMTPIQHDGES